MPNIKVAAKHIMVALMAVFMITIVSKAALADDNRRNHNQAMEDMKDMVYMAIDIKEAFFPENTSDTIIYDQRTYVTNEAPDMAAHHGKPGPRDHRPPHEYQAPKPHNVNYKGRGPAPFKDHFGDFKR
ncbi:MAG: hypothetical protein LBE27_07845 [Deltaproteobacteria bacterium]|jgi:hypothetical protein|nr:hypothetical protein [Deltaproteobacteria bacterium]